MEVLGSLGPVLFKIGRFWPSSVKLRFATLKIDQVHKKNPLIQCWPQRLFKEGPLLLELPISLVAVCSSYFLLELS